MSPEPDKTPLRRALLAPIMLAILGASVVLAWTLTWTHRAGLREGASVIGKIADEGLGAYWSDGLYERWRVAADRTGRVVGWEVVLRHPSPGGYVGLELTHGGQDTTWAVWRLSDDLLQGQYSSGTGLFSSARTRIQLDGGTVSFDGFQTVSTRRGAVLQQASAASKVPDSYIREGMLPLVISRVAANGREADFEMILDDIAVAGGGVNFSVASMTPTDQRQVRVLLRAGANEAAWDYRLDDRGRVASRTRGDGLTFRPVSAEELASAGPDVPQIRRLALARLVQALRESGLEPEELDAAPQEFPQTQPGEIPSPEAALTRPADESGR